MILFDQIDRSMNQQKEIARQRASILVLQMRPHFIYNTMTSIYYLCDQAPQKAKQVTLDFTTYLRKNFSAIVSAEPIPFSEELEHTRAYLAVEQAQFEDRLFVDYDTPFTLFRVPPLTLQPIVENAVKHGMDPDGEPLHITIRSRETDSGIEIIVEDDGVGFDPARNSDDNDPHIALNNIKERLEMMCKGKLTISPREGGGTSIRITLPNKN
jgi:LytS/YehU family sensor histidine kinase